MSQKVRAKFKCNSITDNGYSKNASLTAVYGTTSENADFSKATPSGSLQIAIDKDVPASDFFEPQKDYYLTFEKVDDVKKEG